MTVRARSARASRLRDQVSRTYNRDSEEAPLWAILIASMVLPCIVVLIGYAAAKMGEAVAIVLVAVLVPFIAGHTLTYVRDHRHHAP